MSTSIYDNVLLNTKFHRPRRTVNMVHRPRLKDVLNNGLDHPVILVAAPAGFGKSTLLSAWLETCDLPNAWISLDEADNNLSAFLTYFLGALQTLFPDDLVKTRSFLTGINLPSVDVIANTLINELDGLGRDFILVLDDYHLIQKQSIHELLNLLSQHPPRGMHLVIATRQDPPLPLTVLRARNQIAEIRGQDLRFSRDEIATFVEHTVGVFLTDDVLAMLAEKTEGWAAGLRLTTLTFRSGDDVDYQFVALLPKNRYVIDYLMSEVLPHVPSAMMNFLLKTSILDQMCSSLCAEVIGPDDLEGDPQENLVWLEQTNMFTVALDSHNEWYRYHHLFRELLRDQLTRQVDADEIARLHVRASAWFARQGSLEWALHHALQGHDIGMAVRLVAEHRHAQMDSELWQLYERCLRMFPDDVVAAYPDLLLMAAWMAQLRHHDTPHSMVLVDQADNLLAEITIQPEHVIHLRGEIDTLRAVAACQLATDPEGVIVLARRALATTPRAWYYVRSMAWIYLAAAYQMMGRLDLAYMALAEGQPEDVATNGAIRARVAGSRCLVAWIAGDLQAMAQGAEHNLTESETYRRNETLAWANYLLSCVAYHHNDLATAEDHIRALGDIRYVARPMSYVQGAFTQALIYQARGQSELARQTIELVFDYLRETLNKGLMPLAQAFQAELAVIQGDLDTASHWATTIAPYLPFYLMPYFYAPPLTLPKFLLAQNTPASRRQAAEVLSSLHAFVTATHNKRFTIEVLALQALLHDGEGDEQTALVHLQQAVLLAEPGGFIRLFVDLGPKMAVLLTRLSGQVVATSYLRRVLQAFTPADLNGHDLIPSTLTTTNQAGLVEPLTDRELEVLELLAQRLSAKEIAQHLVISELTAKRHRANIYQKLGVHSRQQAIRKAIELGIPLR